MNKLVNVTSKDRGSYLFSLIWSPEQQQQELPRPETNETQVRNQNLKEIHIHEQV